MLKLERMEILGFKSFYARTRFDFPGGITAVVGPNGCGKSNIGDAISWVLGDQSARSLRGDRMEDVIFSGSEKRKPLGMAEVTLILQEGAGDDGREPIVFTRRLYRSGESEYLINGNRSRLKDLKDLLERRRIATRLSSVIEQGKVDEVIHAKPRDRRGLFEEAAGIAGNKDKKRLASQKLEAAETNLARVADILAEVEARVRSVRRQAAKAQRYRRLTDRIRRLRGITFRERHRRLEGDRRDAARLEAALRSEEAECAARIARLEAEWERWSQEFRRREVLVSESRDAAHRLELERQRRQGDGEAFRQRRAEAEALLRRESERLDLTRRERDEVRRALREEWERHRETEGHREEAQGRAAAAGADLGRHQEEQRATERRLEEALGRVVALLGQGGDLKSRSLQVQEQIRGIREREEALRAGIGQVEREAVAAERLAADLEARLRGAEEERRVLGENRDRAALERCSGRDRLEGRQRDLAAVERRLAAAADRLALLAEVRSEWHGVAERVRSLLSGNGGGPPPAILGEGIPVREGMERALDAALGSTARAFLVSDGSHAADAARRVREAGETGCRFVWNPGPGLEEGGKGGPAWTGVQAGALPSDPRVLSPLSAAVLDAGAHGEALCRLVRRTLVVGDLDAALDLHRRWPQWNYVTPEGEIIQSEGVLEDGSGPVRGAFSLATDGAGLERERRSLEAERVRLLGEIEALAHAVREREQEAAGLALRVSAVEKREWAHRVERNARREEAEQARRRGAGFLEEIERLGRESEALAAEDREIAARRQAAEAERQALEAESGRLRAALAGLREETERIRTRFQEGCSRRDALEVEHRAGEKALQKIRRQEEDLTNRAEAIGTEIDALSRRREGAEAEAERERMAAQGLEEEIADLAGRRRGLEESLEAIRAEPIGNQEPIRAARESLEAARGRLREAEIRSTRLQADLDHLLRSCREEIGCAPDEIPAPEGGDPPELGTVERAVEEIRAKLQRLGSVNLVAVEELEELESRHGFLSGQRRDLLESIASLRETIQRIHRESRERFLTAFEAIRSEFQATFTALFGGGQVQLRLEESDDPLEAGIEIVAQPPGKRLQSIRMLSGGEKALTAIALLFAVFRYRPSAFCVLDEVDAPLDEANVDRFSRMLRQLTAETQFILITHSRRSMEGADRLYGVTMEESGVSKVMSIEIAGDH